MTFDEYKKKVHPGMRVYVEHAGKRVYGIAGNAYGEKSIDYIIQFDIGIIEVSDSNVHMFHLEELN
ncbi:MAG: hypothetical protein KGH64_00620 [Candidatus Micrarchaeota archaeon]|nr:hypothetical protein [Candidatus Micrarchaeota archaeon]